MKTFKSKKDWWVTAIFFGTCAVMLYLSILETHSWALWIITLFTTAYLINMYFCTDYTVKDGWLIVRCGFLFRSKYEIKDIRRVERTRSMLSSPALSLDRLSIKVGKYDEIVVSPADKNGFVEALLSVNPNIDVDEMSR